MDATDDDNLLQRSSLNLITECLDSLPRFLCKAESTGRKSAVRRLVRDTKTDQLIRLLEPFQEWPQLLDPQLSALLQPLVSAFIDYLSNYAAQYHQSTGKSSFSDIIPLPRAICKILYTFCKIRGAKVISQFFNNEAKYLEPMLHALEGWGRMEKLAGEPAPPTHGLIVWQEKYILLLWLSHLLLTPFDLKSISSDNVVLGGHFSSLQVDLPGNLPTIVKRLVYVSTYHLSLASKEREAAKVLLVRLVVRPDMQRIGLQGTLIYWALSLLEPSNGKAACLPQYALTGVLSFLAGFLVSADPDALKTLLAPIHTSIQQVRSEQSPLYTEMTSSTLTRKVAIKISRALAVAGIQLDRKCSCSIPTLGHDTLEETIDYLLTALADKDTTVRIAASKALSVIAVQLEPELVENIVESIVHDLHEDALWTDVLTGQTFAGSDLAPDKLHSGSSLPDSSQQNWVAVNPAKWHGLVLSLSHLMYRESMPADQIPKVIDTFTLALRFEQRSSSGASVGTMVRDAACFGFWALARRCSLKDIWIWQAPILDATRSRHPGSDHASSCALTPPIPPEESFGLRQTPPNIILQVLTNELVVAASLDSAGNIRRGASAALQELVGRHPDTINDGIDLVQVVDYHAVALRSRAMLEVAIRTSQIDETYWHAILNGLLGWRGIGSPDAQSRRQAAKAIGLLALSRKPDLAAFTIHRVQKQLCMTAMKNLEERHGLIIALAEIVLEMLRCGSGLVEFSLPFRQIPNKVLAELWVVCHTGWLGSSSDGAETISSSTLRSPLMLEAVCLLISALALSASSIALPSLGTGSNLPSSPSSGTHSMLPSLGKAPYPSTEDFGMLSHVLDVSRKGGDPTVILASAGATAAFFRLCDAFYLEKLGFAWVRCLDPPLLLRLEDPSTSNLEAAYRRIHGRIEDSTLCLVATLAAIFHQVGPIDGSLPLSPLQLAIIVALHLKVKYGNIDLKCACLRALTSGVLAYRVTDKTVLSTLNLGLEDYTNDQRGDVGSLVRADAVDAVAMALSKDIYTVPERRILASAVCRLAVEKLDKVRFRASSCLQFNWKNFGLGNEPPIIISDILQTSSTEYCQQMLSLCSLDWVRESLLEGYITSAGAGSESLLRASRSALACYLETLCDGDLKTHCICLMDILWGTHETERVLIPTMNVLSFLLDAGILQLVHDVELVWERLFDSIEKCTAKTKNIQKLETAVRIYAGLTDVQKVSKTALTKLTKMLLHPFVKIRNAAADSLYIVTGYEELVAVNWSKPTKELRSIVGRVESRLENV